MFSHLLVRLFSHLLIGILADFDSLQFFGDLSLIPRLLCRHNIDDLNLHGGFQNTNLCLLGLCLPLIVKRHTHDHSSS